MVTIFRKPAVLQVLIAIIALAIGLLVYLLDRRPDRVYFLSYGLSLVEGWHSHCRYERVRSIDSGFPFRIRILTAITILFSSPMPMTHPVMDYRARISHRSWLLALDHYYKVPFD
jgi:hypothetical protein